VNVSEKDGDFISARIQEIMGSSVDICIDCCGRESTMSTAITCVKNGGKICLVGMVDATMTLPFAEAASREIEFVGVFRYRNTYPLCIELLQSKRIQVDELITDLVDLRGNFTADSIMNAFLASSQSNNSIKVMFKVV